MDCGAPPAYAPRPAWSGARVDLPEPPALPTTPRKSGSDYTVFGAVDALRSMTHAKDVTEQPITIVGYVVDSNIPRAPACAVHRTGVADPPDCVAQMPSFWLADEKTGADPRKIRVVGWARNFAVVYDAMKAYQRVAPGKPPRPVTDDLLNVEVPFPLPAVGMKVKVSGRYRGTTIVANSLVAEPATGAMLFAKWEVLEDAPSPAAFSRRP